MTLPLAMNVRTLLQLAGLEERPQAIHLDDVTADVDGAEHGDVLREGLQNDSSASASVAYDSMTLPRCVVSSSSWVLEDTAHSFNFPPSRTTRV